jgi:hypothetical protein
MKIVRLPDTDLARIALLSTDEKRKKLVAFKLGVPLHSWKPFRCALGGIFNTRKSLFDLPHCTWSQIDSAIRNGCRKNPSWLDANLELAKLLYENNCKRNLVAVERQFGAVPVGFGASLKLWTDFYTIDNEVPVISFIDPRRGNGLTKQAMRFVFSMMMHNLAVSDFSDAKFEILRFPKNDDNSRSIEVYHMDRDDIIDLDTLNAMVHETYEIWIEVLEARAAESKRSNPKRASGTRGLFD